MAEEDLQKLFARAAEVAKNVPEAMQDAAFRRALDLLLEEEAAQVDASRAGEPSPTKRPRRRSREPVPQESEDRAGPLIESLDRTEYPQVGAADSVRDRSLWVLRIANDDHSIDGLSAPEIARILTEKFRLTVTHQGVRKSLDRANRLVDRDTRGPVTRYRIMAPGERYLDGESDGETAAPRPRRARRTSSARSDQKSESKRTGAKKAQTSKGSRVRRQTPMAMLKRLVAAGFFSAPKTISDIRSYVEQKQGRRFKASELSPGLLRLIREGSLDREKNADGQYEYSVK